MDCEKFETTMIDELYDELDELTSAAAKRHVAGCARCAALLGGLRATRRLVSGRAGGSGGLSVEPPADLEERILAAAREAQKVVPVRRMSRVVSWAGNWAMKPQTQMAAVFLLMIGSSVFLLRGKHAASSAEKAAMTVTEQGAPAASALARTDQESLDTRSAESAHGTQDNRAKAMATATTTPQDNPIAMAAPVIAAPTAAAPGVMDSLTGGAGREADKGALGQAFVDDDEQSARRAGPSNAGAIGGAGGLARAGASRPAPKLANAAAEPPPPPAPAAVAAPAQAQAPMKSAPKPMAASGEATDQKKKESRDRLEESKDGSVTFGTAKAAFDAGNFGEATRQFDAVARSGDLNAALWAARSVRSGSGCSIAVTRFTQLATRAGSGTVGNDARLEAGQCLRQMGSFEAARAQLVPLITVPSHGQRAQRELSAMPPSAAARATPRKAAADQQQAPYATPPQAAPAEKANGF